MPQKMLVCVLARFGFAFICLDGYSPHRRAALRRNIEAVRLTTAYICENQLPLVTTRERKLQAAAGAAAPLCAS